MGISFGHDTSGALIVGGKIVANVAEEQFARAKNDGSFLINALEYFLKAAGIIDVIVLTANRLSEHALVVTMKNIFRFTTFNRSFILTKIRCRTFQHWDADKCRFSIISSVK